MNSPRKDEQKLTLWIQDIAALKQLSVFDKLDQTNMSKFSFLLNKLWFNSKTHEETTGFVWLFETPINFELVCLSKTPPAKLLLKMFPSFRCQPFFSAKKTGSAWSIDANLMVPALSSCSEYQGIHFPLEPTKKWQHDATCMRFLLGIVGMFRLHKTQQLTVCASFAPWYGQICGVYDQWFVFHGMIFSLHWSPHHVHHQA